MSRAPSRYPLALVVLVLASSLTQGTPSHAGPNTGGYLILHAVPELLQYSSQSTYCAQSGLRDLVETRVTVGADVREAIVFLLSAFPNSSPELRGLQLGIDLDPAISLFNWGDCADFVLVTGTPLSDSNFGVAFNFDTVKRSRILEIAWFAAYADGEGRLEIVEHPVQGPPTFADDHTPANIDPADGLGTVGFGVSGWNPCLEAYPHGACCYGNGACSIEVERICERDGGAYLGDGAECEPRTCEGACCVDETCSLSTEADCYDQGGEYKGPGTRCGVVACIDEKVSWGKLKSIFE